jgi:hypothetical protein
MHTQGSVGTMFRVKHIKRQISTHTCINRYTKENTHASHRQEETNMNSHTCVGSTTWMFLWTLKRGRFRSELRMRGCNDERWASTASTAPTMVPDPRLSRRLVGWLPLWDLLRLMVSWCKRSWSQLVLRGWLGLCVTHRSDIFSLTPGKTDAVKSTDT